LKERTSYDSETVLYKCIAVKSVTYAQKAKKILGERGIDGYLHRGERSNGQSCHWCVKVRQINADRAYRILLDADIPMTGEIYEIR
jgi:hypothetical protein